MVPVSINKRIFAAAVLMMAMAGTAHAAAMKADLKPVPAVTAQHDGDFDGDGRRDALYLADEPDTGRVAVHVRLNTVAGEQDIRVSSYDANLAPVADLRVMPAGQFAADCGTAVCGAKTPAIATRNDSLMLNLDGVAVLMHWQGDHFEQDFVHADTVAPWTGLAHTIAALYASNR